MSQERVLQYEFFMDKQQVGEGERFVVRAYFSRRVLRNLPLRTQWALRRYIAGRAWYEDFLPQRLGAWLSGRLHELTSTEFRDHMVLYLRHYMHQPDQQAYPLGCEHRSRRFILATKEERFSLAMLLDEKRRCTVYVFSPNHIMAPTQIFLLSAN